MKCGHAGFHRITSRYDREAGILIYVCICERCGEQLKEVRRISYRPRFESPTEATRHTAA
jgi:hypothetical protein